MLKTEANPERHCRSRRSTPSAPASPPTARSSTRTSPRPFYGANRPGAQVSQGVRDAFWLQEHAGRAQAARYECIKAFSETDLTRGPRRAFDVPTLVIHGDDDQIVPIAVGGRGIGGTASTARP